MENEKGKRFGFSPALRVRKKKEYDRVFDEGRKISAAGALLVVAPNGLSWSRLGVIAAKRLGGAVGRNRVKRLFREAFRLFRGELPAGVDIVVVPRPVKGGWTLEMAVRALRTFERMKP